jgi:hypothetical protein
MVKLLIEEGGANVQLGVLTNETAKEREYKSPLGLAAQLPTSEILYYLLEKSSGIDRDTMIAMAGTLRDQKLIAELFGPHNMMPYNKVSSFTSYSMFGNAIKCKNEVMVDHMMSCVDVNQPHALVRCCISSDFVLFDSFFYNR